MKLPPHVQRFTDRHGHARYYFRKRGCKRVALPHPLAGMKAFLDAYAKAESGAREPVRVEPQGTMAALITDYLASPEYRGMKPSSRRGYARVLNWLRNRPSAEMPVKAVTRDHIVGLRRELADTPGKANLTLKVLGALFLWAMNNGYRQDSPVLKISAFKGGEHRSWTDAELLAFETKWQRGTKQRLVYELALGTGQRREDIARMTWGAIKDGAITLKQGKTGAELTIPLHPSLVEELALVPRKHVTIVQASVSYLTELMGTAAAKAGLPDDCVLHGLRKAAARRLAEAGCTDHEIMSITGHKSLKDVQLYTKAANQKRLGRQAMGKVVRLEREQEVSTLEVKPRKG